MVHLRTYQNVMNFLLITQGGLQALIESIKDKDPDKVSVKLAASLDTIAELELLQVRNSVAASFTAVNLILKAV